MYAGTLMYQLNEMGWSETYWMQAGSYEAAGDKMIALWPLRSALLVGSVKATVCRISQNTIRGDAYKADISVGDTISRYGAWVPGDAGASRCNRASDALLLNLYASEVKRNRIFLRGIPDNFVYNDEFHPDAGYIAATVAFTAHLVANQFYCRNRLNKILTFAPIIRADYGGVTSRKTGLPFGLRRGRRAIA